MAESVQQAIARRNKETAAQRRGFFSSKATDQKHHENLFKCTDVFVEAFDKDPASGNTAAALRELRLAMTLSRRKLQQ